MSEKLEKKIEDLNDEIGKCKRGIDKARGMSEDLRKYESERSALLKIARELDQLGSEYDRALEGIKSLEIYKKKNADSLKDKEDDKKDIDEEIKSFDKEVKIKEKAVGKVKKELEEKLKSCENAQKNCDEIRKEYADLKKLPMTIDNKVKELMSLRGLIENEKNKRKKYFLIHLLENLLVETNKEKGDRENSDDFKKALDLKYKDLTNAEEILIEKKKQISDAQAEIHCKQKECEEFEKKIKKNILEKIK